MNQGKDKRRPLVADSKNMKGIAQPKPPADLLLSAFRKRAEKQLACIKDKGAEGHHESGLIVYNREFGYCINCQSFEDDKAPVA